MLATLPSLAGIKLADGENELLKPSVYHHRISEYRHEGRVKYISRVAGADFDTVRTHQSSSSNVVLLFRSDLYRSKGVHH